MWCCTLQPTPPLFITEPDDSVPALIGGCFKTTKSTLKIKWGIVVLQEERNIVYVVFWKNHFFVNKINQSINHGGETQMPIFHLPHSSLSYSESLGPSSLSLTSRATRLARILATSLSPITYTHTVVISFFCATRIGTGTVRIGLIQIRKENLAYLYCFNNPVSFFLGSIIT